MSQDLQDEIANFLRDYLLHSGRIVSEEVMLDNTRSRFRPVRKADFHALWDSMVADEYLLETPAHGFFRWNDEGMFTPVC